MAAPKRRSSPPVTRTRGRQAAAKRPVARRPQARFNRFEGRGRPGAQAYQQSAQRQLRRFRQGSLLAVAVTALLLVVWAGPEELEGIVTQEPAAQEQAAPDTEVLTDPTLTVDEAAGTIRDLALSFYGYLPRIILVLVLFAAATLVTRTVNAVLRRSLRGWERIEATTALTRVAVFLAATVASLSILAGDVRAVVGSVGLLGLAASWALQTPIESFTGWLLNSFRRYYRVGDRIAVGDVFGDVYRIDVLTTTVWEAGGPGKPVAAAQPTGALITFPNWEVLRSNIINYTRDFPYIWDEVTINIANESDLGYAVQVLQARAKQVLGEEMAVAATEYQRVLRREGLMFDVEELPRAFVSLADSWTDLTIRYVVPIRTRRHWASTLILALSEELAKPDHAGRILSVYPRTEITLRRKWPGESAAVDREAGA
jgi:small conductance mechanosensitive channel